MSTSTDTNALVQELLTGHQTKVAELEQRSQTSEQDILAQLAEVEEKFDTAKTEQSAQEAEAQLRILQGSLAEVRKAARQEEQDLAEAVFSLNAIIEQMGGEYADMGKLTPSEQALITQAENRLAEANQQLQAARIERQEADNKWFFKRSAINAAELGIAEAQTAIFRAEQGIESAQNKARQMARQRLLSASMEDSLQEFQIRVEKTIQIMEERMEAIHVQVEALKARLGQAQKIQRAAAEALTKLDEQLDTDEQELKVQEQELDSFTNGTPEYAAQEENIRTLRHQVEELRGRRNTALVLHQSKQKFASELEVHLRSQTKLRDNQKMWITSLRSDTEERVVTFKSRLEAMKAISDQDIAKDLDSLGAEVDQRNIDFMAAAGAAADRLRMDKIEEHPERLRRIEETRAAQARAVAAIREREADAIAAFHDKYGIDPTKSSFFLYQEEQAPAGAVN